MPTRADGDSSLQLSPANLFWFLGSRTFGKSPRFWFWFNLSSFPTVKVPSLPEQKVASDSFDQFHKTLNTQKRTNSEQIDVWLEFKGCDSKSRACHVVG
jgi:hypothetical protein